MALLAPGPLGTASGNIGGVCIALTKQGAILRSSKQHCPQTSALQRKEQLSISAFTKIWQSAAMNDLRPAWNTYARNHPVPNRLGTPRLVSGYTAWLRFLPIHRVFYPAASILLGPPATRDQDYMSTISAGLNTTPYFAVVAPGNWHFFYTYEQVQIARFQPLNGKLRRPIWRNACPPYVKIYSTMDLTTEIPPDLVPIAGETWGVRIRWWSVYYDAGRASWSVNREPLPWSYCTVTA